jgi:hypothetical protein
MGCIDRRHHCRWCLLAAVAGIGFGSLGMAQGPPPLRRHRANAAARIRLVPADRRPPAENRVAITEAGDERLISSNDIPEHDVGAFPNRGNPHAIAAQRWEIRLPLHPTVNESPTFLHDAARRGPPNMPFAIGVNGVLFDPGTAEYWMGDRDGDWNYEALGGGVPLGLDANHAHVQPGGIYHYHGLPTGLLKRLGAPAASAPPDNHPPLIGWAADGFPVYCLFGHERPDDPRSPIRELRSSYRLKPGPRPAPPQGPGGSYDGAFVQDYEYAAGSGDLDECNGRQCVTPEFPSGTYAYFLTTDWPVIPRAFRGTPVNLRAAGSPRPAGRGDRRPERAR